MFHSISHFNLIVQSNAEVFFMATHSLLFWWFLIMHSVALLYQWWWNMLTILSRCTQLQLPCFLQQLYLSFCLASIYPLLSSSDLRLFLSPYICIQLGNHNRRNELYFHGFIFWSIGKWQHRMIFGWHRWYYCRMPEKRFILDHLTTLESWANFLMDFGLYLQAEPTSRRSMQIYWSFDRLTDDLKLSFARPQMLAIYFLLLIHFSLL